MLKNFCLAALLICFLGSLPASPAEITGLDIQFPYAGESYTVTPADGTFRAGSVFTGRYSQNNVAVNFYGKPFSTVYFVALTFDAPYDAVLTPGTYSGATLYPFEEPANPGFSLDFDSQGFNELNGAFTIRQLVYGPDGSVEHFGASFVDYNNQGGVGFTGNVYYNYDASAVPEPQSIILAPLGVVGLLAAYFLTGLRTSRRPLTPAT